MRSSLLRKSAPGAAERKAPPRCTSDLPNDPSKKRFSSKSIRHRSVDQSFLNWGPVASFSRKKDSKDLVTRPPSPPSNLSPSDVLLFDMQLLEHLAVGFPRVMIRTLLARAEGNSREVCKYLRERGWISEGEQEVMERLSCVPHDHYSTPYFWGQYDTDYQNYMDKAPPGSFFTALEEGNRYVLVFKRNNGTVLRKGIGSPVLHSSSWGMSGLQRPESICHTRLMPFDVLAA